MLPCLHLHTLASLIYGCVWVYPCLWGLALSVLFPQHSSPQRWHPSSDKLNHLFLLFFLPFNYHQQKMCTSEVELNITAVFFWWCWCYNNKSSSLLWYSATCCWQIQHWGKINNRICDLTPSSHRKPPNYSAFFSPVLLDLCPRLCSATAGFGPKILQELMGNLERIYIYGAFSMSGDNNNQD